ncbi:MAG: hypothetical protein ACOYXT_06160 [Bacteroidota bacterium]
MKKAVVILFFMLFAAYINSALAQDPAVVTSAKPGWHKVGEVSASFKMDNESIVVLGNDKFKALKFKITDSPIDIQDVKVFYENGEMEEIGLKGVFQPGEETKSYDLKGYNQELKKVVFTYKTAANRNDDRAHVELYGLK